MNPLVSVIVPTFDGEQFVRETLESVLAQDYSPIEVIVCDDGSRDGTLGILESYGSRLSVVRQKNQGVAAARNRAAQDARGEFIAFLDHDDVWEPNMLTTLVPLLAARPEVGLVYADAWIIDAQSERRGRRGTFLKYAEGDIFEPLLHGNFVPVETTLMRTALFRDLGGCDPSLRYLEDFELCLRIARHTTVGFCAEPLARYRIHERNLSHELEPMLVEWLRVLDTLEERVGALAPAHKRVVQGERDRLCADLAWRAARRGNVAGSAAWARQAGVLAPRGKLFQALVLRSALRGLPQGLGRALLKRLPRRKLYGVQVAAQDERRPG
ncbi:MAG: glycosyltransferase [Planctomycetes bacterium]|nr:glycosyltransferase [Planctomycetota bacterium]